MMRGGELTQAILRTSQDWSAPANQFAEDLAAFTKHYIERPRFIGFPSRELSSWKAVFGGLAVGVVALDALVYHATGQTVNVGAVFGELIGAGAGVAWWGLSERHAKRQISDLKQYTAGQGAETILLGERYHRVEVDVQTELYSTLLQEGADLNPDQFLDKIYGQIPQALVNKRHAEVDQAKYPKVEGIPVKGSSLPRLVEVSHVLQSVEAYLRMANDLKAGLAS